MTFAGLGTLTAEGKVEKADFRQIGEQVSTKLSDWYSDKGFSAEQLAALHWRVNRNVWRGGQGGYHQGPQ